jgi:Cu(I)/Ag(I) efflux system membrane fusion protein
MALEPVYADDPPREGIVTAALPADAIHVTPRQEQLIGVQFGIAESTRVFHIIRASARVGVNENRVARVQSKLEGYIDHIYVTAPGERVTQGQLLLSIYNRRAYSMAQMQFLQAAMDATGMSLPATDPAHPNDRRLAAAEALRDARQQLEMMGFTGDQIDAIHRAQQPLFSVPVHAPISGIVLEKNAALNQKPGMEPLLTIADLSTIWATAYLSAGDAAAIEPGQAATLAVPNLPQKVFHGFVRTVLPELDASTSTTKVLLQFDNAAYLLKPGMYGEVEVRSHGLQKLTVPEEAVVDRGRTQVVFVDLGGGYLEPREVRTGERFGDRVEIVQGLTSGQRIVTSGNFLLDSESQMRLRP